MNSWKAWFLECNMQVSNLMVLSLDSCASCYGRCEILNDAKEPCVQTSVKFKHQTSPSFLVHYCMAETIFRLSRTEKYV
jgi:hypothetical protein